MRTPISNARISEPTALTIPNGSSIGSTVFARPLPHILCVTLIRPIFPKICPSAWRELELHSTDRPWDPPDPGPTILSGIVLESAVFHNTYSLPTDRPTDRQRASTISATRPNNNTFTVYAIMLQCFNFILADLRFSTWLSSHIHAYSFVVHYFFRHVVDTYTRTRIYYYTVGHKNRTLDFCPFFFKNSCSLIVYPANATHHPKWQLSRVSHFSKIHARHQRTDGRKDRRNAELDLYQQTAYAIEQRGIIIILNLSQVAY